MRIDPRKHEIDAIVEILEDPGYDSDRKMAADIIRRAYKLILQREWWIIGVPNGGNNLLWGPLPTENEALKYISKLGLGGDVGMFKVFSVAEQEGRLRIIDVVDVEPDCKCGHDRRLHDFKDGRRSKPGCSLKRCRCKRYVPKPD